MLTAYIIFLTPEGLLRLALGLVGRTFYRVTPVGLEALPATGGVLLLPNHISYVDAVILQLACPRPIRFLVYDQIYQRALSALGPAAARRDSDQPEDRAHGHRDGGECAGPGRGGLPFPGRRADPHGDAAKAQSRL